jgi:alkylation response protein AidB-like acyl-CoA dehydrogenase
MTEEQKMICATIRRFVREEIVPLEETELDADAYELPEEHDERLRKIAQDTGIPGATGLDVRRVFMAERWRSTAPASYHLLRPLRRRRARAAGRLIGLTEPTGGSDPARAVRTAPCETVTTG